MSQTFAELGLNPERIAGLEMLGYEKPSRLQREVIPQLLAGRDVVVEGAPGSGKTAAFVLPILQTLNPDVVGIQVLIFTPTGGDAARVAAMFQGLNGNQNLHIVPVSEEQPIAREAGRIDRTAMAVVGTPGRLKAHVERETFGLDQVQVVVIDGVDQLLEDEQLETLEAVLDQAPGGRQTAIFATQLDAELQDFADQHLFEPVVLKREAAPATMPVIKHRFQSVLQGDKTTALLRLLDGENIDRGLVFVNLRPDAERVAQALRTAGYHAAAFHTQIPAEAREGLLRMWRDEGSGAVSFLVLTQAAASDLVLEAPYAVSFDIPTDAETYASRAMLVAENGSLFTLLSPRERALLSEIENYLGTRVKAVLPPTRADTVAQRTEAFKQALRDIIGRSNLEIYMMLLGDLAEEGHDWSEIAAAAVSMLQHAQAESLFSKRSERRPTQPAPVQPQPSSSHRYREPNRESGRDRDRDRDRSRDEEREVEPGYIRLIMDAGYDVGVRPKDIVGAIANEANIPGRAVGNIDIRDRFTYVEVQEEFIDRVLNRVPSTRLRGRVVTFRRA